MISHLCTLFYGSKIRLDGMVNRWLLRFLCHGINKIIPIRICRIKRFVGFTWSINPINLLILRILINFVFILCATFKNTGRLIFYLPQIHFLCVYSCIRGSNLQNSTTFITKSFPTFQINASAKADIAPKKHSR
jgi:hypothetical protein